MDAVIIDPPAALIAERQRLGLDRFDEVWDGEYHMVPGPRFEHQRMGASLTACLFPVARDVGLHFIYELNLIPPDTPGWNDFRVPDLVVCPEACNGGRGAIGAVSLVGEIRSPGDESFQKLPFYERLGVGEVLIIDRDTKAVRYWINGPSGLVEQEPGGDGLHRLRCLPVALGGRDGQLVVETAEGVVVI